MSLAAVEKQEVTAAAQSGAITGAVDHWRTFPASEIAHHGEQCCRVARAWITRMDASLSSPGDPLSGPRWIRQRYAWGPSSWPIHWCEAVEEKVLDCGALAAMSRELFAARGLECYAAQFIQRYTPDAAAHWDAKWQGEQACIPHWIRDDLIYHEGCAVVTGDDQVRIWDPTPSWWVNSKQFDGYGSVLALRISGPALSGRNFRWGDHSVPTNVWHQIEPADSGFALPAPGGAKQ